MTKLFDYSAWVHRAQQFVLALDGRPDFTVESSDVSPPLPITQVEALARRLDQPLPSVLRLFLEFGAAALNCRYTFEYDPDDEVSTEMFLDLFPTETSIYGGAYVGPANRLPSFAQSCAEWAEVFRAARETDKADEWADALPMIAIANGDYIAVDGTMTTGDADDPPVLYLSHDGENVRLADSFTAFLTTWERLCYLGPEIWLLDRFRDDNDGLLDPHSREADQLRQLFGVPNGEREH